MKMTFERRILLELLSALGCIYKDIYGHGSELKDYYTVFFVFSFLFILFFRNIPNKSVFMRETD